MINEPLPSFPRTIELLIIELLAYAEVLRKSSDLSSIPRQVVRALRIKPGRVAGRTVLRGVKGCKLFIIICPLIL